MIFVLLFMETMFDCEFFDDHQYYHQYYISMLYLQEIEREKQIELDEDIYQDEEEIEIEETQSKPF